MARDNAAPQPIPVAGVRADAGTIRLTTRDIRALLWLADMYAAQGDTLARLLDTSTDVVRQLHARWRRGGYVETGRLGPGPVWCWLTRHGLDACDLPYTAKQPPLGRLRHLRAVATVRLTVESWTPYHEAGAHWRSERRLRWQLGAGVGRRGHVPDAEIHWPDTTGQPTDQPGAQFAGEIWCVEVELTPKTVTRTTAILREMLARTGDYGDPPRHGGAPAAPRYARILYLTTPAARPTVDAARTQLPQAAAARVDIRPLPDGTAL
ncbi:MAG: hypothetical protein GEV03_15035 [Streptosporangiales bacterium]|nr:hypothetical protein [Streptosporangiales bacterium]